LPRISNPAKGPFRFRLARDMSQVRSGPAQLIESLDPMAPVTTGYFYRPQSPVQGSCFRDEGLVRVALVTTCIEMAARTHGSFPVVHGPPAVFFLPLFLLFLIIGRMGRVGE